MVKNIFSSHRRRRRRLADRTYTMIVNQSRNPIFYADIGVPDTMEGRFELILMHLFAVVNRLTRGADPDSDMALMITESFVTDMDHSLRELGVGDVSVGKKVKRLYKAFRGRLEAYDRAFNDRRDTEHEAVRSAISRNFDLPADPANAQDRLCAYLVAAVEKLQNTATSDLLAHAIPFPEPDLATTQDERS